MKDFYIHDCAAHENQTITSSFVVAAKQVKLKKSGEPYLALSLADRSGALEAKVWDNVSDCINAFEQEDVVKVKGLLNRYNTRWQLTVHKLRRLEETEIDLADYLPRTTRDVEQLWRRLRELAASLSNPWLQPLLAAFMDDPEIAAAYQTAPAAKSLHHAFIGGLLEHVVSLSELCLLVCRNYPALDRDLLLAGAFLHDIGKIHELAFGRAFTYTPRGQLLGHMIIELEMLQAKIAQVSRARAAEFPPDLKNLVEHMIISHHGQYQFGSPKLPMFPEALVLHYLDDLDSKMEAMRAHFARHPGQEWTDYNPALQRPLLNSALLQARLAGAPPDPPPPASAGGENKGG